MANSIDKQALKSLLASISPEKAQQIIYRLKDEVTSQGCTAAYCTGSKWHSHIRS